MEEEHIIWTKKVLAILKIGGEWLIPRSLVRVIKENNNSVIIISPKPYNKEHEEYLKEEITLLRAHIQAAGYMIKEKIDDGSGPMS